ncbi:MAG TPA: glycosyl hydrolase [Solirubrobacterales bacterium]|nr:glycosyl hydrolase [Solirubrobacterales bacterium]
MYFGATISGETYGQTGNAPRNVAAWDLFERHAGKKVAILNQGQPWVTWDSVEVEATHARGAIPLVTMGLGSGVTLADIAAGKHDAAIKKWALEAKAWGHPFLFAPWWEMNGGWYAWGRSPSFIAAWRRFHDVVAGQGATNVTWTWLVNSIWEDPESDPTPYYPGDAYVDWTALDSYNWGRNPAQPDKWITPEQTITPTLKLIRAVAPTKPFAIVENASSEYGGNKTDWIREMLTTYLPHHPEIRAYMWFNWPFQKGEKRSDWPIETSAPAQQQFRKAIGGSLFAGAPVSLPKLIKVPPPPAAANDAARPEDLSPAAEMVTGADVAVAADGAATVVWSARAGSEWSVFARRVSAAGARGPVRQLSAAGGDALAPQIAVAPNGTAVVAWVRWDGANFRVQERRLAADGTPEEATRTLSGSGQDAAAPRLDVAPDGEATVVWQRWDGFHYLVQVRQVAPDGTSEAAAQRLSEAGRDAVEPRVAVADDGTATVVWSRFDGEDSIVQTRRVEPDGTLEEASEGISLAGESAIQPRVGVGPDGTATVVWNRFDGANWVIQARRMNPAGVPAGAAVNLSASGRSAAEPQLALDPDGAVTVVWDRFDGTSFVVQARRLDPAGVIGATTFNLSAGGRDAADPQVATSPQGTATVLWSRFDGSNWLVQRRDVDAAGALGTTATLSVAGRRAGDPALAWGEDGTLAMSWRRFAGNGDVVQVNSVPKPEVPPPPPPPPPPSGSDGDGEAGGGSAGGESGSGGGSTALAPDNSFRIAGVRLDRRRGTARLTVAVPGPGLVALDGAVPQQRQADVAGKVVLRVLPKRKARRLLERQGSARMRLIVTFIPSGGSPNSRGFSLRLKKQ